MSEFRWDHLHLRSPDPEATAQYYVDVFGATPVNKVDAGGALRVIVNLAGLNLFIEQVPPETPAPPHPPHLGLEHIGLAVTNIDAVCAVQSELAPASIACARGRAATSRHAASRMASTVMVRRRNWSLRQSAGTCC